MKAGSRVWDHDGTEWVVYLEQVMVPCVRLTRFNPAGGDNQYKDIPLSEFQDLPGYEGE